jgi:tRNA(fMet)-specific endonuclease VapC
MIVDTNALSAYLDGDPEIEPVFLQASNVTLSSVVLGEYRFGILRSKKKEEYLHLLAQLQTEIRVFAVDQETAAFYAEIRHELKKAGTPIPWHDIWIAAQARQHQTEILSRDAHFDQVDGLKRITW